MDTEIANTHQFEAWNGYEGRHWAENADRYEGMVGGWNRPLFEAAAIGPEDRVLDIGCGSGATTRRAAQKAHRGHALGVDLSGPMLERARETTEAKGPGNVSFEQGDAQVHPFPEGRFDVAISRGGCWYFSDPVAAFANIARALRPGGRIAIGTPDSQGPDSDFPNIYQIMGEHLPQAPSVAGAEVGTEQKLDRSALSIADDLHEVFGEAGLEQVSVTRVSNTSMFGRTADEAVEFVFGMGPVRHWFKDASQAAENAAREAVRDALVPYEGPGGIREPGSGLVTTATRP